MTLNIFSDSNALPEWNLPKDVPNPALLKEITPKSVQSPIVDSVVINAPPEKNKIDKIININGDSVKEPKVEYKANEDTKDNNPVIPKEDNLKVIDVKDKINDPQKDEKLIHSDAINKEESELAAAGELPQLDVAQRHEELKRTLEKYKKEQREMMKEQKEILKDIKEQQLELQKKKDELLKVPEEEKKNDQKAEKKEVKVINIESEDKKNKIEKEKNLMKEENEKLKNEETKIEETKIKETKIEKIKEKSEFKETVVNEKKIEKNEENMLTKGEEVKIQDSVKSSNNELKDKNIKDTLVPDSGKQSSDHILNALTKNKIVSDGIKEDKKENDIPLKNDLIVKKVTLDRNEEISKLQEYAIPIALKMSNQTKVYNDSEKLGIEKKKENPAVGRDILENRDREKRDINDTVKIETKVVNEKNDVDKSAKICEKNDIKMSDKNIMDDHLKEVDIKDSLIVTSSYLSQQSFNDKISIESDLKASEKIVKIKKRDLKYLETGKNEI